MSAAVRQASIEADPTVPAVTIVREFDATPDKVFRAHVDPELAKRRMRSGRRSERSFDFGLPVDRRAAPDLRNRA